MYRVTIVGVAVVSAIVLAGAVAGVAKAEVGICCYPDGSCQMVEEADCWATGGCAFYPGAD
ncbi:MAG: hypothetical protein ACE15D_14315 [Candidatus Eisenbacteria bacterium]|nr:hypothetical protein [Candidatus Eisenbacteria bacterium]